MVMCQKTMTYNWLFLYSIRIFGIRNDLKGINFELRPFVGFKFDAPIFLDNFAYFGMHDSSFIGMNSILVYVGHGILWRHFPFSWEMDEYGGHAEKLGMSLAGTALWVLIAYCLFTKNFFLKI